MWNNSSKMGGLRSFLLSNFEYSEKLRSFELRVQDFCRNPFPIAIDRIGTHMPFHKLARGRRLYRNILLFREDKSNTDIRKTRSGKSYRKIDCALHPSNIGVEECRV